MLIYHCAKLIDIAHAVGADVGDDVAADIGPGADAAKRRARAEQELALLTPIAKAFLTEAGHESANLGLQCFGGHGYIREWGMEQNVRDARIATIYEGTTGIQAIDLLGRKVLGSRGALLKVFTRRIDAFAARAVEEPALARYSRPLEKLNREWQDLSARIGMAALQDPEEAGAASVDYLMYSGYIVLGYFWAEAAAAAQRKLDAGEGDAAFLRAKLFTARFYLERLLPRTRSHAATMLSGADNLMDLDEAHFAF